jgi:hypothetical protein
MVVDHSDDQVADVYVHREQSQEVGHQGDSRRHATQAHDSKEIDDRGKVGYTFSEHVWRTLHEYE